MWTLLALLGGAAGAANVAAATPRPRLVVVISIDQFRADYLTRFDDLYLPPRSDGKVGGFRYLQTRGAWYPDCRYAHHRTVTGAGHAILGSGAQPSVNGVVGNSWFDRASRKSVYCVQDPKSQVVGALAGSKETPMSAANLLVTTVADELELATGGAARTVSLSLKDRAAILMSGHRTDAAVWFDEDTGGWVSSNYYCPDGRLPEWATELNAQKLLDPLKATPWEPSVSAEALERTWRLPGRTGVTPPKTFSHRRSGAGYGAVTSSPAGNEFVFQSARKAVEAEALGQDAIPDLLTLNLASNDYVGHGYGPDSAEVLDISVQTDRQLSEFLNFLAQTVPGGLANVTVAISADHGVVGIPELLAAESIPASRAVAPAIRTAAERALDTGVGAADWIASMDNGEIYFGAAALAAFPNEPRARLESRVVDAIAGVPGVYFSIGKSAILSGQTPRTDLGERIAAGFHPSRSGDVVVILDPQWLAGAAPIGTGTSHGTPFTYDTHVALLLGGFGVRAGTYGATVEPAQLAPTLSHLLGVARPSAADEPLLPGLRDVK